MDGKTTMDGWMGGCVYVSGFVLLCVLEGLHEKTTQTMEWCHSVHFVIEKKKHHF